MFGNVYHCTKCKFSFLSGWSHHEGGQFLVCAACGTRYILGGGQSCWGAQNGERLQLFTRAKEDDVPTGITVVVSQLRGDSAEDWDGVSMLQFDDIPCPSCRGSNILTQSPEEDTPCPASGTGVLKKEGRCIY